VARFLDPVWASSNRRESVAGLLGPVWTPWGRGRSPGPRLAPLDRGRSLGPRLAIVGAWLFPWALAGRRWSVTRPQGLVWLPWGRGPSPGPCLASEPRLAAVKAWPVPWAQSGCHGGVDGPLGPVWHRVGVAGFLGLVWQPLGRGGPLDPV